MLFTSDFFLKSRRASIFNLVSGIFDNLVHTNLHVSHNNAVSFDKSTLNYCRFFSHWVRRVTIIFSLGEKNMIFLFIISYANPAFLLFEVL